MIKSSNVCHKANMGRCPPMLKRNGNDGNVSSSTENSIRRLSSKFKLQMINEESRMSRAIDDKDEGSSGKKTIRKHLHVRAYKKLFTKHAKTGENHGPNASKEVKVCGDVDRAKEGVQDERELCVETIKSLEKKDSKTSKLLEQSREELHNHDPNGISIDSPSMLEALQIKKVPFSKLSKLPVECTIEFDDSYLNSVNCLREFWYKSLNAVLIDGQERISKSILFVLSLLSHACRPFLIITRSGFLQQWQADFLRLAPSVNVIMYKGTKDVRKIIQSHEFYEESGCLTFQVLLADPKAVVEDMVDLAFIGWESIIVDECQNSKMTGYLKQLNTLYTDFKLLLFNGQLKDGLSDYRVLLSFLNTRGTMDNGLVGLKANSNEAPLPSALTKLKEKLARHIVFECKTDSSKFLEYWVPVPLSSVQVEQYCSTLFSNATALRSNSRSGVVGDLHNILIAVKKCCDHPYLVDGELRGLLTKGLQGAEFFNAEVCASGKLYLLGKILQDIKDRGLRVVILFQSLGGSEKVSLGDILDDFLDQRFGVHTYERIETGMVMAKKVAALKKFNNKEARRFVFLIEKRACLPSTKLRSVDAIILFNSDWNPLNDLRSLQKISVESQHNCIRVFRLYTSYTVEEKLLMLAKQDIILDSCVESLSRSVSHSLLCWGTSYLFRKLDQLHSSARPTSISEPSFDKLCLNDVILEILTQLPGKPETSTVPCSILMKAELSGGTYSRNIVLLGEKEGISLPDNDMPSFWSGFLEGRHPKWMYKSKHSQRIRRRIQNANGLEIQAPEGDEVKSKRRKINNVGDSVILPQFSKEKADTPEKIHEPCLLESEGEKQKFEGQRKFLMLLRPELSELCDILGLPESVKVLAEKFLVYIMNNHDVSTNQVTLQALKISLCWRAASMSRHILDRGGSLSLAKRCLKFECTEKEAYSVYSKLQILEEKFLCQSGASENLGVQNILDNHSPPSKIVDNVKETLDGRAIESATTGNLTSGLTNGFPIACKTSEQLISEHGHYPIGETPPKFQLDISSLKENTLKNQIDGIEEFFLRRSKDLAQKHLAEVSIFRKQMHKNRLKLEKTHELDLEFIRSIHIDETVSKGKINILTHELSDKLGRFDHHHKQQKQKLMSLLLDMRNKEQELKCCWLEKAKTGMMDESLDVIPNLEIRFRIEKILEASKFTGNCYKSGATILKSACPSGETNTGPEGCLEVPSNILKEQEENARLGDGALASSPSVIGDNLEQTVQNRLSVVPAVAPGLSGALPVDSGISTAQSEVLNLFSSRPAEIGGSITAAAFNFKQQECRNDSNGLHLVPIPELNQGAHLAQGLASYVSASTLFSIQELGADEHTRPAEALTSVSNQNLDSVHEVTVPAPESVVALSPHTEMISRDDVATSKSTNCLSPLPEHEQERLPPAGYQEATPQSHLSFELSEVPVQHETMALVVETEPSNCQSPEDAIHPLRPQQNIPSEGIPSEHFTSTVIQCGVACDWPHSSTQPAEVLVQDAIEVAISESELSTLQIPEPNLHPMRPQEDLPLERTHSERLTGIQLDEPRQLFQNFISMEWVPPQAIFADPITNELSRLQRQEIFCTQKLEHKKLLLQSECEQELEKVKRKYDILLQDAEKEFLNEKTLVRKICQKILWHKVFAEEIMSKLCDHKNGSSTSFQAPSPNSSQHLPASRPQPLLASRPSSSSPPIPLSTAPQLHPSQTPNQAPTAPFPPISRLRPFAGSSTHTSPPLISSDTVRGNINPYMNLHIGRSPAPHLQRVRPPRPTHSALLNSVTNTVPSQVYPPNFVSPFPAPFCNVDSSISNACGISPPTRPGPSPLHMSPPPFEFPQHAEADALLESLLANLPVAEFLAESAMDSRPNASLDVLYLSDED